MGSATLRALRGKEAFGKPFGMSILTFARPTVSQSPVTMQPQDAPDSLLC